MSQNTDKQIIHIHSVGLLAPGLPSWSEAQSVLSGQSVWEPNEIIRHKPQILPPNERRRATDVARLVFKTSEEALDAMDDKEELSTTMAAVFASSGGDYQVIHNICTALSKPEREVSPTQFHNSVHNAPAGYWSIATGSQAPSTSLSAFDYSFIAGLLEASLLLKTESTVMLSCYDNTPGFPLSEKRQITQPFSVSFILGSEAREHDCGKLIVKDVADAGGNTEESKSLHLENLRQANPAARSLPLLESLVSKVAQSMTFTLPGGAFTSLETIFE